MSSFSLQTRTPSPSPSPSSSPSLSERSRTHHTHKNQRTDRNQRSHRSQRTQADSLTGRGSNTETDSEISFFNISSTDRIDTSSTKNDIMRLCDTPTDFEKDTIPFSCTPEIRCSKKQYVSANPGPTEFTSMITPVSSLTADSAIHSTIIFKMRRKNRVVTLQWEPFSCILAANGITYLSVLQSITNLPPYQLFFPILIIYKNEPRMTKLEIDPFSKSTNIKIYITNSEPDSMIGDQLQILGSSVSWIIS